MTASVPIWFDALQVGHIDVAADGTLSLRYGERWLQTAGAFPLSVTMPLRTEPYPSEHISPWLGAPTLAGFSQPPVRRGGAMGLSVTMLRRPP